VNETADIILEKRALRCRIKTWRAGLEADAAARAAGAVAAHGLGFLRLPQTRVVISGFASLPDEFRAWPLLRRLHGEGHALALPVMQGKSLPLVFRAWAPGDAMDKAVWGIAEPKADKPVLEPDIVLVPLLAFDATGWRLGYGGGYYDRTLAELTPRPLRIGLGYADAEIASIHPQPHDVPMSAIVTDEGVRRIESVP
jgi:5-formyltetrahydrofolate cyclo-ligase